MGWTKPHPLSGESDFIVPELESRNLFEIAHIAGSSSEPILLTSCLSFQITVVSGDYHSLSQLEIVGGIEIYRQKSQPLAASCFGKQRNSYRALHASVCGGEWIDRVKSTMYSTMLAQ